MKCAAVQFDICWEDKPRNHARIEELIDAAGVSAGTFVLLPEMCDTGFSFNLDQIVDETSLEWACQFAREREIWLQVGYAARGDDGRGRNRATIIDPQGDIVGSYDKVHPFSFGQETEHFTQGDHLLIASIGGGHTADRLEEGMSQTTDGTSVPPTLLCPLICYDLRFPELWRLGALAGAEVFTIGASWPAVRQDHWRSLLIARAIENQCYVVACNRTGEDPHIQYEGGSIIISPKGEVLAEADARECVLQMNLAIESLRAWRSSFPALADMRDDLLGSIRIDQRT